MAFIEPMHRNKPNITYLLTYWVKEAHVFVSAGYQATVALREMKELTN